MVLELELWKVEVAAEEARSPGLWDVLVRSVRSPSPLYEAHRCSPHSQAEHFAPVPAGAAVKA